MRLHLCLRLRTAFTRECLACKTIARIEKIQNQPSCFYFTPLLTKFFFFFSDDVFFLLHHHKLHLCGFCVYYHCAVRLRYAAWCLHAEKVFHLGADETGRGVSGDLCSKQGQQADSNAAQIERKLLRLVVEMASNQQSRKKCRPRPGLHLTPLSSSLLGPRILHRKLRLPGLKLWNATQNVFTWTTRKVPPAATCRGPTCQRIDPVVNV